MKTIYISGPMTGVAFFNYPLFNHVAAQLCEKADTLVILPGWQTSKGAQAEYHLARRLGLQIATIGGLEY